MGQAGPKLRTIEGGFLHWCPACESMHPIAVSKPFANGARWTFDGNLDVPTFNPSINISYKFTDEDGGEERCHYFIHAGKIEFQNDCTHTLKGQTVGLPDLPPDYQDRKA